MDRPNVSFVFAPIKDQVKIDKEKEKVFSDNTTIVRSYTTSGTEKKLLGDAMTANRQKHISRKKQRKTIVVEEEIPKGKLVDVKEETDIGWTESYVEGDSVSQGHSEVKDSTGVKNIASKGKRDEPASTRGPGPQVKKRRFVKVMTNDRKVSLLQDQKVLNGRVFEPTAMNRPCIRKLVEAIDFQGWGHLFD